ncbi:hypothetical protein IFM89_013442 [Coptis chinensis]|uniref:Uncharacterized protein n=1 Tax=Coptis chinensis TaxID=261450 RepID=A0A835GW25_9MAGN|nr:hypothetical protein IFM89_013442 [Coptis chinensis]
MLAALAFRICFYKWSLPWRCVQKGREGTKHLIEVASQLKLPLTGGRLGMSLEGSGKRQIFAIGNYVKQRTNLPGREFRRYAMLGDDVVIAGPLVAKRYEEAIGEFQLDPHKIRTWSDLANAFLAQYKFNTEMESDRCELQRMQKKEE